LKSEQELGTSHPHPTSEVHEPVPDEK